VEEVTEDLELVDLEAVHTVEPVAWVEVVTEEVELADLEAEEVGPIQEAEDLEAVAVAHTEDLVDLEVVDMAETEADWEEVASVEAEVNQVLEVQAVAVLLGEDMEVVDL
jgi:hypothetical protein